MYIGTEYTIHVYITNLRSEIHFHLISYMYLLLFTRYLGVIHIIYNTIYNLLYYTNLLYTIYIYIYDI